MSWWAATGHRKLLFHTYLFLAAGLVIVAAALDIGFGYLQTRLAPPDDQWLDYSFRMVEAELKQAAPHERVAVAERLGRELGVGVQLLRDDDMFNAAAWRDGAVSRLSDLSGGVSFIRDAPSLNGSIRLGPVEPQRESFWLRMVPPLFYLSIFVVVGLWLKPLLNDLDLIARSARRFAADYRSPLATAGKTTQLTELARNLDEMSIRLSSLIQSQKELAAALSHELRTPLARIRFGLAVLDDGKDGALGRQLREINADVQDIDELISAILDYARLDHPDLRMRWEHMALAPWLRQTLEKWRQGEKQVEIAETGDGDAAAWMDPRMMALALSNLIVNASRYAARRVRVSAAHLGAAYELVVEDDGPGVPEAERSDVFKAFTRLDTSRSRDTGGHGLGLAIVARIAALHGGSVTVSDSADLGGARFTVRWPEAAHAT